MITGSMKKYDEPFSSQKDYEGFTYDDSGTYYPAYSHRQQPMALTDKSKNQITDAEIAQAIEEAMEKKFFIGATVKRKNLTDVEEIGRIAHFVKDIKKVSRDYNGALNIFAVSWPSLGGGVSNLYYSVKNLELA